MTGYHYEFWTVASTSRAAIVRSWLTGTFSGITLLIGFAIKLIAFGLTVAFPDARLLLVADTIADVLIVIASLTIGYYLFVDLKRLVLWRVRRRLTLSVHLHRLRASAPDHHVLRPERDASVLQRQRLLGAHADDGVPGAGQVPRPERGGRSCPWRHSGGNPARAAHPLRERRAAVSAGLVRGRAVRAGLRRRQSDTRPGGQISPT